MQWTIIIDGETITVLAVFDWVIVDVGGFLLIRLKTNELERALDAVSQGLLIENMGIRFSQSKPEIFVIFQPGGQKTIKYWF